MSDECGVHGEHAYAECPDCEWDELRESRANWKDEAIKATSALIAVDGRAGRLEEALREVHAAHLRADPHSPEECSNCRLTQQALTGDIPATNKRPSGDPLNCKHGILENFCLPCLSAALATERTARLEAEAENHAKTRALMQRDELLQTAIAEKERAERELYEVRPHADCYKKIRERYGIEAGSSGVIGFIEALRAALESSQAEVKKLEAFVDQDHQQALARVDFLENAMLEAMKTLDNPPGISFEQMACLNVDAWKTLRDALGDQHALSRPGTAAPMKEDGPKCVWKEDANEPGDCWHCGAGYDSPQHHPTPITPKVEE